MRFTFYSDPGHAWLEVEVSELQRLGIHRAVSSFSYMNRRADLAYLEEDADAPLFIEAYCKAYGLEPSEFWARVKQVAEERCFVRGLSNYNESRVYKSMGQSVGA